LAFATTAVDAPHRIETPTRLLFRGVPVRAVRSVAADPKVDCAVPDSSPGVHRSPLRRHNRHCVHLPVQAVTQTSARDCHVPSVFRSCRSSRLQRFPPQPNRSEDLLVRQSAGLLHPAAGHGVHQVSDSLLHLSEEPDPKVVDPKVRGKSSPVASTLRSVPLLGSLGPCRHRVSSFRTRSRSPTGVPSRRSSHARFRVATPRRALLVDLKALFHRGVRCDARDVAAARPLDAPLGFGSITFRCCRACRAAQSRWTSRLAARTASASPDPNVEGRQGVSALSGSLRSTSLQSPKGGLRVIAVAPAPPEGDTSAALRHA